MNGTMRYLKAILQCGLLVMLPQIAVGARDVTITVKVTVEAPPCVINENKPITVEFGDVMTTRVDGNNYRMPVNYTLSCPPGLPSAMKLQIWGAGASFDNSVLYVTGESDLGIQLQQGKTKTKLPINTSLKFNYPNNPELWAVPVKRRGATLAGGKFEAGATMTVDYQ
ncbi:fimbrial protein [Serratia fonticola]